MSLIGEALKRLSEEERPPHLGRPHLPVPRRSPWPWVVAAAAVSLAIGVLVGVALLPPGGLSPTMAETAPATELGEDTEPQRSTPDSILAPRLPPEPRVELTEPSPHPSDARLEDSSSAEVEAQVIPTPSAPPEREPPTVGSGAPEAAAVPPTAPSAGADAEVPRLEAGRTYFGSVLLPDGDEIVLIGIAWSDTSPVALLDNGVFSPGEGANRWVVAAIEPRQVEIEWDGVRFFVRMR